MQFLHSFNYFLQKSFQHLVYRLNVTVQVIIYHIIHFKITNQSLLVNLADLPEYLIVKKEHKTKFECFVLSASTKVEKVGTIYCRTVLCTKIT